LAQVKDAEKRRAIRDAAVAEVIDGGLSGASVAKIAKRAGVSAGTIYLYFPNKDELLQQVYLEIKTEFHDQMMAANDASAPTADKIHNMWLSMFHYLSAHPNDFLFAEYVSAAKVLDAVSQSEVTAMSDQLASILRGAINDGTLGEAPIDSIVALLVSPATQLVRKSIVTNKAISRETVDQTYTMIWKAIAAS
jgi:AcrR family transcriptional regulator